MNNIEQYKKRFYNLMESEMGNVKPLINEDESSFCDWDNISTCKKPIGEFKFSGFIEGNPKNGMVFTSGVNTLEVYPDDQGIKRYVKFKENKNNPGSQVSYEEGTWSCGMMPGGGKCGLFIGLKKR
jgi:hypothetical protein